MALTTKTYHADSAAIATDVLVKNISSTTNGGIITEIDFTWKGATPYSTRIASFKPADIWVNVRDSANSTNFPLGEIAIGTDRWISIPWNNNFYWANPYKNEIENAEPVLSKMSKRANALVVPGYFTGQLQAAFRRNSALLVAHDVTITVTIMEFE